MNSAFLSSGISGICQYFHLVFIILLRNTSNSPGGFLLFHGFGTGFSELVVIARGLRQRGLCLELWNTCGSSCRFAVSGCLWPPSALERQRRGEAEGYEVEGVERGQRWRLGKMAYWHTLSLAFLLWVSFSAHGQAHINPHPLNLFWYLLSFSRFFMQELGIIWRF